MGSNGQSNSIYNTKLMYINCIYIYKWYHGQYNMIFLKKKIWIKTSVKVKTEFGKKICQLI